MASTTGAISAAVNGSGKSRRQVSIDLGRNETFIGTAIQRRRDVQTSVMAEIAAVCGYQLQLVGHGETIVIDPPTRE